MGHCGPAGAARQLGRAVWRAGLLLAVGLGAAGCSPEVAAWRSLNGTDINDPNPQTAPFSGNLATAYQQPYPNLASVPPPPIDETSTAERRKLAQTLIANRSTTAALGVPSPGSAVASTPASASAAMPHPTKLASNSPPAGSTAAPARKPGEPPEPQPLDSSLAMPTIAAPQPQPQTPQPPPPNPTLAALPPTPPPAPLAAPPSVASAMPAAPPPLPVLAPIAPPPIAAKPPAKPRPAVAVVATLDIAPSLAMEATDRAQLARIAALYKEQPATVRIVAFAAAPPPGTDPLALYHAALDRAQAIARALAADGVPAGKIQTAATPASGAQIGRIEIEFAP
jgi:hypothetical protein